ncbi:SET domain-containing protein [Gammaproteobacteria bacterium]
MEEIEQPFYKTDPFEQANIEIRPSPLHRYGVFAKKDIAPKKVIEECPVILFSSLKRKQTIAFDDLAFLWDDNNCAVALGYGSMYNHSTQPNANFVRNRQNQVLSFIATKRIPAGTEILINYGDDYWTTRNKTPLDVKPQNDSSNASRVIVLLFLLLGLSKIFPLDLHPTTTETKTNHQAAQALTNPLK